MHTLNPPKPQTSQEPEPAFGMMFRYLELAQRTQWHKVFFVWGRGGWGRAGERGVEKAWLLCCLGCFGERQPYRIARAGGCAM